jgi:LCP family protein required for cell wall assembly
MVGNGGKEMKFKKKVTQWFNGLSKAKKIAIFTLAFIIIFSSTAGAIVWHRLSDVEGRFGDVLNPRPNPDDDDTSGMPKIIDIDEAFRDQKVLNILLIGFDRNAAREEIYDVFRPDTLMLASINLDSGRVDLISIPRDSLVPIYRRGGGVDKINHSFYYGWASSNDEDLKDELGLEYTINTVRMALGGVPIHFYITIDMDGVVEAVNIMGGVWYDVPHDVVSSRGILHLRKGYQRLNGHQFLNYARNRQYVMGDIERTRVQQSLLVAAFSQFKQANSLIKAPQAMLSMRNNIQTNLSTEQMLSLALFATNRIDRDNIHQHTLEGRFASGRVWENQPYNNTYWIINNTKRAQLLKEIWGLNIRVEPDLALLPPRPAQDDKDDEKDVPAKPNKPADPDNQPSEPDPGDDDQDEDPVYDDGNGSGSGTDEDGDDDQDEDPVCDDGNGSGSGPDEDGDDGNSEGNGN